MSFDRIRRYKRHTAWYNPLTMYHPKCASPRTSTMHLKVYYPKCGSPCIGTCHLFCTILSGTSNYDLKKKIQKNSWNKQRELQSEKMRQGRKMTKMVDLMVGEVRPWELCLLSNPRAQYWIGLNDIAQST